MYSRNSLDCISFDRTVLESLNENVLNADELAYCTVIFVLFLRLNWNLNYVILFCYLSLPVLMTALNLKIY